MAVLLAACGRSASIAKAPVAPTLHTAPPVSLTGVHLSVLADSSLAGPLDHAVAAVSSLHHGLVVTPTLAPTGALTLDALTTRADAYLFAVPPSQRIEAQLGGVLAIPVGQEALSIGADLPTAPVLTLDQLAETLDGSIRHWNSSALGRAAISSNLRITVSTSVADPVIAAILEKVLGITAVTAPTTAACSTTPGCLDFSLGQPPGRLVGLSANGATTIPSDHGYPLETDEVLEVERAPLHPRTEYAALVLARSLLASGNLPAHTVSSVMGTIANEEASLAIDVLTGEGR